MSGRREIAKLFDAVPSLTIHGISYIITRYLPIFRGIMFQWCVLAVVAFFCSSCAATQNVAVERYVWPPPPDVARIEWLKTYSSQLDIEKTASKRFWDSIGGEDTPRSFKKPSDVKSIPELNKFLVADIGLSAVVVFDLDRLEHRTLDVPGGAPPLYLPLSIAVDRDGFIYVLERRSAAVLVFDKTEKYQRAINLKPASVSSPTAMVIDKKNSLLFVSDAATRKIVTTDLNGGFIRSFGGSGERDGEFNLPVAMAMNSKGQLLVADAFNARIQVFDGDGRFVAKFGKRGDAPGTFQLIKSIAVDSSDNIYVVDGRAHNISIFNEQGDLLLVMGGFYASTETGKLAPGGFSVPVGIDIDATDKIFVVDQMNARVQIFQYFSEDYLRRNRSSP